MVRKISSILLIVVMALTTLTACSTKSDYTFWQKENQLRLVLPVNIEEGEDDQVFTDTKSFDISEKYIERISKLKNGMIDYFLNEYNIDISEKLSSQKIKGFFVEGGKDITLGYVDPEETNILHLNKQLFEDEYVIYFDNTYIHESLHQIGFVAKKTGTMITEGIVDALADLILETMKWKSYPTPSYQDSRTLGYQILLADKGIVEFYLNNSEKADIARRINKQLADVEQPFIKEKNIGERLDSLIMGLTNGVSGSIDIYYVAFETQEIVRAYCQTWDPDEKTIDSIRAIYLVEEYETVQITKKGDGYEFNW